MNRIGLITIVTSNLLEMKAFYRDVLGFECIEELEGYVEFRNMGVRFAITTDDVMYEATEHQSYRKNKQGQRLELAFPLPNSDAVAVAYDEIVAKGAIPVAAPVMMPWGRMTAFFADPDGNIHELYSLREGEII
ncbi:MAG: VOC family protein [Candidatus Bathyarchaeota archaeon]|nr:VOC family protein [Candidatus Bathyarchaeota archaeon]